LTSAIYTTNSQQRRLIFVGIGSSYWAARISEFLWREHVSPDCISLHSYDLVKSRFLISTNDIFVLFSHRGTKTFSLQALEIAKKSGATTILVTGIGSPGNSSADIRIETCAQENCGAFTISLTSAIARIIQWIGLQSNKEIIVRFNETIDKIQLPFNIVRLPSYTTNFVIVGDLIREAVAHEVSLKISETCYLPVRSFGLEQFLHGPKVTIDKQSSILAFTSKTELRKESLLKYAEAIGSEVIEINEDTSGFDDIPQDFVWLAQLLYGQYMALELSRRLGTNPDTVRADQSPYNEARDLVTL
jgi:fructoselysine-6-P-deglycase FrlB-like protein